MIVGKVTKVETSFYFIKVGGTYGYAKSNSFDYSHDIHILVYGNKLEGTNLYSVRNILKKGSKHMFHTEFQEGTLYVDDPDSLISNFSNSTDDLFLVKYELSEDISELKDRLYEERMKTNKMISGIKKLENKKSIFSFFGF